MLGIGYIKPYKLDLKINLLPVENFIVSFEKEMYKGKTKNKQFYYEILRLIVKYIIYAYWNNAHFFFENCSKKLLVPERFSG